MSKEEKMIEDEATRSADDKAKKPELPGIGTEVSGQKLKSFIGRIERLEEEKKSLAEDIKDIYSESKGTGFDPKIIRKIVSLRKKSLEARREEQELLDLYTSAIGMSE